MDATVNFTLNGKSQNIVTDPDRPLLEVLREDLHLTGTKFGCGEGACRACTVLINGQPTPSCITPLSAIDGQTVLTIEGLAVEGKEIGGKLHPVQDAFLAEGAFQCGYCTVGMIMGVAGVMKANPGAGEAEVMAELQRHICRCGSYVKYRAAVRRVVSLTRRSTPNTLKRGAHEG